MPHKHNPIAAICARAAAMQAPGAGRHAAARRRQPRAGARRRGVARRVAGAATAPAVDRIGGRLAADERPAPRGAPRADGREPGQERGAVVSAPVGVARLARQHHAHVGPPARGDGDGLVVASSSSIPVTAARPRRPVRTRSPASPRPSSTSWTDSTSTGADVIGLSIGAMIAMAMAIEHPARVERLALLCTSAQLGPASAWHERAATVRAEGAGAVAAAVVGRWLTPDYAADHPDEVAELEAMIASTDRRGVRRRAARRSPRWTCATACRASPHRRW